MRTSAILIAAAFLLSSAEGTLAGAPPVGSPPEISAGPRAPLPPMWPEELPVRVRSGRRRSIPMMVTGIVITGFGVATLPLSIGMMMPRAYGHAGSCSWCAAWSVVLPVGAIVPPAIGIPLWVSGASEPGAWSVRSAPAVSLGPGSASLRWSF